MRLASLVNSLTGRPEPGQDRPRRTVHSSQRSRHVPVLQPREKRRADLPLETVFENIVLISPSRSPTVEVQRPDRVRAPRSVPVPSAVEPLDTDHISPTKRQVSSLGRPDDAGSLPFQAVDRSHKQRREPPRRELPHRLPRTEPRTRSDKFNRLSDVAIREAKIRGFIHAASTGNLGKVTSMLETSPDLLNAQDVKGRTALHLSYDNKTFAVFSFLIDKGARTDLQDWTGFSIDDVDPAIC